MHSQTVSHLRHTASGRLDVALTRTRHVLHGISRKTDRSSRRRFFAEVLLFGGASVSSLNPLNASAAFVEEVQLESTSTPSSSFAPPPYSPTYVKATGRIIAIGDLHGDWTKAVGSFRAANVIRVDGYDIIWTGGDSVVVQLGDVLDRGDHEIAIVKLMRDLHEQALQQGGGVYMLNGNHESLNICGDFRYVTPGAFVESALYAGVSEEEMQEWNMLARVRYAVYRPGGPMAMELSKNPTVLVVNDTAFVHGGLLPVHVNYGIEKINHEVSAWMRAENKVDGGKAQPPFLAMGDASSIMWNRSQSKEKWPSASDRYTACRSLQQALDKIGASRLVVGHTPQISGANCECDGRVWRMDVGMSYGVLNRPVQVLEIDKDAESGKEVVRVLVDSPSMTSMDDEGEVLM
ncbi:hypothetical protein CEUSTIGMA_g7170.t1 [Chlamydomonas eustigma]|uniref:Calcineurin-like phosphoesterase domain-containing protein n=1 Tax=Chlamydomonas eustigma TaxID=1157962 RepID=A0A250XA13_9CHLO|nr:hypothetical protein CEUSTIGMA_g7170.t1 [Chlamydomonas eustigma]|eukprot:GAX79729.1 hypothetical protein CEUSTIGMA_g7170.t1 [Chlamydomonas eustigma]